MSTFTSFIRLSAFALLFAAVAFVFGACDSGGGGPAESTVVVDSMQLANVTPDLGAELPGSDTSFTFTFNKPVIENEYTRTDVEAGGGDRHLIDRIRFYPLQSKAKNLTSSNTIPVSIEFNDDRTELTITPQGSLQDGFIYLLDVGEPADDDYENGEGFYDSRFKSERGARYAPNPNFPKDLNFTYSVGKDSTAPAVPSVSFEDQGYLNPVSDDFVSSDDTTIANEGQLDLFDDVVTAELRINNIDTSNSQVKGYEVYYRSQNQVGRNGTGDTFVKATEVWPEASPEEYEAWNGIIPADAVLNDEIDDGQLEFVAAVPGFPLISDDGSYGPIEWKVRAVSINNVRSDFTDVIETGDNTAPEVEDAFATDEDGDGDDDFITVVFSEWLRTESVRLGAFTLEDDNGNERNILDSIVQEDPEESRYQFGQDVRISLDEGETINFGDTIEVDDDVTDLADNGVDPDANEASF